jgi:hypothetical protein
MDTKSSKTHESSASKISITGALAEEVSLGASFGEEVLKESNSSRRFLLLFRVGSLEKAGGGDKVDPLSSQEILASSPSWPSSASGASEAVEAGSILEEEDGKPRIDGPTKESVTKC